ncbi:dipeptidase [Bacillus mesophilum]|uniref:Membrane dipeptidase n=1 Tax=Bacillus mesophilum TaxID=1071718 RepID=A0A7V7RQ44_9BACI|nr:dipeptidase [Bacillus mesophilum]KAB2335495.1 membrane dipeptidase [Bacillus mesophilum]
MTIFDAHCDVLCKMLMNPKINFQNDASLQVNMHELMHSPIKVQCFAIYVPEAVHPELKFIAALRMIEMFYERIIHANPHMKLVKSKADIKKLKEGEVGALLTLEGCDAICKDIVKLQTLLRLGVTSVGLTWNYRNCAADGVLEENAGGLSQFGRQVLAVLNERNIWCDVSHLAEKGFWDVMEYGQFPVASHSNCYSLCQHPRNLKDDQIKALIQKDSVIGLTFVAEFLSGLTTATIDDLLRHLDYICSLGGEHHVGFGSDFDGTEHIVAGIERASKYDHLINVLSKYYSQTQLEQFLFQNFVSRLSI